MNNTIIIALTAFHLKTELLDEEIHLKVFKSSEQIEVKAYKR